VGERSTLLFDGTCNLCHGTVTFVLGHERDAGLTFASLQSPAARAMLAEILGDVEAGELTEAGTDPDSISERRVYRGSDAALRVARHLRWPYWWLAFFLVVPRPLRDLVYRFVARNRYRWFGRSTTCLVPSPELASRFLG
jgi:predicted DCC family thiol-disulfide oxidoreductase YuxK